MTPKRLPRLSWYRDSGETEQALESILEKEEQVATYRGAIAQKQQEIADLEQAIARLDQNS